jgi:hypothetical protein
MTDELADLRMAVGALEGSVERLDRRTRLVIGLELAALAAIAVIALALVAGLGR